MGIIELLIVGIAAVLVIGAIITVIVLVIQRNR